MPSPAPGVIPIIVTFVIAVAFPIILIAVRHQVRVYRIHLIDIYESKYGLKGNSSFEAVREKYMIDLAHGAGATSRPIPTLPFLRLNDWMLLLCALPFMIFSSIGFYLVCMPLSAIAVASKNGEWLSPTLLTGDEQHTTALTVLAFAFLGAFFFSVRLFLRAIIVFDLSAATFLRAFVHVALASIVALLLWRLSAAPGEYALGTLVAVVIAFLVGFMPDAGMQWLLGKLSVFAKRRYIEVEPHAPIVPLTIVDGIDAGIAFRLEEANIFDIQNLSTANPVMLCVETPYTIFEVIDWVAQAQLCTAVGPEKFLLLRRVGVRTILDLERAILGGQSTEKVKLLVGSVLFANSATEDQVCNDFKLRPVPLDDHSTPPAAVGVSERRSAKIGVEDVKQWVHVIVDDLHIHRLRQICWQIADNLKIDPLQIGHSMPLTAPANTNGSAAQPDQDRGLAAAERQSSSVIARSVAARTPRVTTRRSKLLTEPSGA